jgi:beta-galactosidase
MVHGGTNFGLWAGANVDDGGKYLPHITSYDYDAPISEAGDYGQPGIGGDGEKFALLRAAIVNATGAAPPAPPPRPALRAYGAAEMRAAGPLLAAAPRRGGVRAAVPLAMEEFQQRGGAILYRTRVPAAALAAGAGPNGPSDGAALDLGAPVHDYAHILVDGALAGRLERDGPANLTLSARGAGTSNSSEEEAVLDVLVHAMGRQVSAAATSLSCTSLTKSAPPRPRRTSAATPLAPGTPRASSRPRCASTVSGRVEWGGALYTAAPPGSRCLRASPTRS